MSELEESLISERYDFLTDDEKGISLVLESLYCGEPNNSLEEELFALFKAWGAPLDKEAWAADVVRAADKLCHLLDEKASRMAAEWADKEIRRLMEEGANDEEPEWGFDQDTRNAIAARGVTGFANL